MKERTAHQARPCMGRGWAVDPGDQAHSPGTVKGGDLDSGPALLHSQLPTSHESHRVLEYQDKRVTWS